MARATPDTEYYKTTQVSPTAASTGSAVGSGIGAALGGLAGWFLAPYTGGASAVASMAIGAGLGAGVGGPIGTAAGAAAGEEEVELPVTASPARHAPPGPSSLSGLASQGWAWERIFSDMDKKAAQENVHAAELQNLLSRGSSDLARFESNASAYTELPSPEPSWARFSL